MGDKSSQCRTSTDEQQLQPENSPTFTSDSNSVLKDNNSTTQSAKSSELGRLQKLFKSPATTCYEETVTEPRKDWDTGNPPGGGPYRPLAATPGMDSYYASKAGTGSE
jgi:hypothetical protein